MRSAGTCSREPSMCPGRYALKRREGAADARTSMSRRFLLAVVALVAALAPAPPAAAALKLPAILAPVAGNPADRMLHVPIEASVYDRATRCTPKARRPGVDAFARWLDVNAGGVYWGSYRCEMWGKRSASLHAEKRAVDWHLNAGHRRDAAEARRIITVLLAPDRAGNGQALARRMGVEEIIWDCAYWGAGMSGFRPYSPCFTRSGRPNARVSVTTAHRDHIHFGMTRAGAAGRTSFWAR